MSSTSSFILMIIFTYGSYNHNLKFFMTTVKVFKHLQKLDFYFLVILFFSTIFEIFKVQKELSFIFLISLYAIVKIVLNKTKVTKISTFDIGLFSLFSYIIINFSIFSKTTFYYTHIWVLINCLLVFYLLTSILKSDAQEKPRLHLILLLILVNAGIQAGLSFLQQLNIIKSKNEYFMLVGSFNSPNHLAAYCGFGLLIVTWFILNTKFKYRWFYIIHLCYCFFLCYIILISDSRGTWIALSIGLIYLLINSKRVLLHKIKLTAINKIIISIAVIFVIILGGKYLSSIKSESIDGRKLILKITTQEILKKPYLGYGLYNFTGGYNRAKIEYFKKAERSWEETKVGNYVFTAFNDFLLIGYELGLPFLISVFLLLILILIKSRTNKETQIGVVLIIYLLIWMFFNSILEQPSILLVGILGVSIIFAYGKLNFRTIELNKFNTNVLNSMVILFCVLLLSFLGYKNYSIIDFNRYSNQQVLAIDKNKLIQLAKSTENNRNNNFSLGKKIYDYDNKELGFFFMEKDFERTLHPKIGKQLAALHYKNGNYKRAKEIYTLNNLVEPFRYEWLMNLISLNKKCNDYDKVVKLSDKVINYPVKIPSKAVEKYKRTAKENIKKYSRFIDSSLIGTLSKPKFIKSKLLQKKFSYKIYLPHISEIHKKLPVIYFNDGQSYIKKGNAVKILDNLINNKLIQPVAAVFLEPRDGYQNWKNVRQELFICNPLFVDFFTQEFIPHIEKKYPVSSNKKNRSITGISFGGLAAAYLGIQSPKTFENLIMQSPAFHPCKNIYNLYDKRSKQEFNVYISYGTGHDTEEQDLPFIKILKDREYPLKINKVEGGNHEWDIWKSQLKDIYINFWGL